MVDWFLAHGADPNATCLRLDWNPLGVAVARAPMSTIKKLFDHGGSIEHGQLLHAAAKRVHDDRVEVLNFILSKGADVNEVEFQRYSRSYAFQKWMWLGTPLHYATDHSYIDVARRLLEHGANPLIRDSKGQTVLERAKRLGQVQMYEMLQAASDAASPPEFQFTDGQLG